MQSAGCLDFFIDFDERNVDSSDYALLLWSPQFLKNESQTQV